MWSLFTQFFDCIVATVLSMEEFEPFYERTEIRSFVNGTSIFQMTLIKWIFLYNIIKNEILAITLCNITKLMGNWLKKLTILTLKKKI